MVLVPGNNQGWINSKDDDNNAKNDQNDKKANDAGKPSSASNSFDNAKTWQMVPDRPKQIPQPPFIAHRSAIFGEEFPTLGGQPGGGVGKDGGANQAPAEVKYGPGPSLRPQTSGNWLHGGKATFVFNTVKSLIKGSFASRWVQSPQVQSTWTRGRTLPARKAAI